MKKRIIIVLGILIAAGGIGTGVWYHFYGNIQGKTGDSIVYVSKVSVISGTETAAVNRFAVKDQYETTPLHVDVNIVSNDILDVHGRV